MSSYPKEKQVLHHRASRSKNRESRGNQFSNEEDEEKLNRTESEKELLSEGTEYIVNPHHRYRIIEFFTVFHAITEIVICKLCKEKVTFTESGQLGLGFKIIVSCTCSQHEINSGPVINTGYEVNRRVVLVMRLLGIGRQGINVFCGLMDMCQGLRKKTYNAIMRRLHTASESVFKIVCEKAVHEERQINVKNGEIDTHLHVSGDGFWKERGFSSLYGVTTLIAYNCGKIIDLIVKSEYCFSCITMRKSLDDNDFEEWYEEHLCTSNHECSSGKMEIDSIVEMFTRSEKQFGVKYVNYIGHSDSKFIAGFLETNPYGDEFSVKKSECVDHVQERMGTRLRNKRDQEKLGGENGLTESLIKKLTTNYGLAIRGNINSVDEMKKAIMATLDHYCSTNRSPQHKNCPKGADSWCEWRQAESLNTLKSFKHPDRLISNVIENHIRPIYVDLSNNELLTKCLGGFKQNSNDSFNSVVSLLTPKHQHLGKKTIDIVAYLAAGLFNEGYSSILNTMQSFNLIIGEQCKIFAGEMEAKRMERGYRRHSLSSKEAKKLETMHEYEFFEEIEGLLYGSLD